MAKSEEKKHTIILGVTGSIAAFRACDLILDLKKSGVEVIPVMSRDAHHFVTPLALRSLAMREVYSEMFDPAACSRPVHTELVKQAQLIVVCPASADILARMRAGLADDLLSCVLLAAASPVLVVPAMNEKMYAHPATKENLEVLKKRGVHVLEPGEGRLVCGDYGKGHLPSSEKILAKIRGLLRNTES